MPWTAAYRPETVSAAQTFLRGGYRAQTAAALGIAGAGIGVFIQRSSSVQNNFSLVTNMCAVFSHRITLVSWAKASPTNTRNAGNLLLAPREA
jgi:hypothetical protein